AAKIEITLPVRIPNVTAFAALKHEVEPPVTGHHILREQFLDALRHRTTSVPTPASVKISNRIECGIRPSTNCTFSTPLSIAATALSTFGIIPSAMTPDSRNRGTSSIG